MGPEEQKQSQERVLLLAPTRRDAEITRSFLTSAGLPCMVCHDLKHLCAELGLMGTPSRFLWKTLGIAA